MTENPLINRVAVVLKTKETGVVCDVRPAYVAAKAGELSHTSADRWVLLLLMSDGKLEMYRHDEVRIT